jgi:hypothetical protein
MGQFAGGGGAQNESFDSSRYGMQGYYWQLGE